MQRNRNSGGHRGGHSRGGRGGGHRGGGRVAPSLPSTLRDQLGMPAKRGRGGGSRKDRDKPVHLAARRAVGLAPQAAAEDPSSSSQEEDEPVRAPIPKARKMEQAAAEEHDTGDAGTPFSGVSRKKKVDPTAMTPLARLLAGQTEEADPPVTSKKRKTDDAATIEAKSSKKSKQTKSNKEASIDPSIMRHTDLADSLGAGGKGKSKAELDEDEEIRWLEWKLGMGKYGKGKKSNGKKAAAAGGDGGDIDWDDDGLDDLLDFADGLVPEPVEGEEDEEEAESGSEMDDGGSQEFSSEAGSVDQLQGDDDDLADYWTEDEDEDDEDSEPPQLVESEKPKAAATSGDKKVTPDSSRKVSFADDQPSGESPAPVSSKDGGRYIPPALRRAQAAAGEVKSAERIKLERKLQGLLNKLSEANIESIVSEIEAIYRENSRNDVTTSLSSLIIGTISDRANLLDSFFILYAALAAALYKVIGMEFGAQLLQSLVTRYLELDSQTQDETGKQPLNLLTLIAELYNFQVVACLLIYDLIRGFIEKMTATQDEYPVEALLRVMKCTFMGYLARECRLTVRLAGSGSQLRSDDPTSLKDIVQLVQTRTSGDTSRLNARTKFMIETMVNVSTNKTRAVPGGNVAAESTQRMKKFLSGLNKKRHVLAHEPLRVSLADLQNADTRGRWWMVGAGWSGDPLREKQLGLAGSSASARINKKAALADDSDDELALVGGQDHTELLALARKQGMNTDVRRSVFVTLLTSDDYTHACDRLAAMKHTETQQREHIRVALHCSGLEQTYNPYYTLVLAHLCAESFAHRITLQYAAWDLLRDLGETEVGGESRAGGLSSSSSFAADSDDRDGKERQARRVRNLGMTLAWVVAEGGADLSIFKPVDFTALGKPARGFFLVFFSHLLLASQTKSPMFKIPTSAVCSFKTDVVESIFERALITSDALAQGVGYFLTTRLLDKASAAKGDGDAEKLRRELRALGVSGASKWSTDGPELAVIRKGVKVARKTIGRLAT